MSKQYFVPCATCDGHGYWVDRYKGDIDTCFACNGTGRQELASQEEVDEFWEYFSEEDFK